MWQPTSYADLTQALGILEESADLDFKRELAQPSHLKDLAKDAAAMSVEGGVIVVGVDEAGGVASALTPIPLAGSPERVQQVIASRVRPPLAVETATIADPAAATHGFLIITVEPSSLAPHMFEQRYPARAGSTTRWMEEAEIHRLYERRRQTLAAEQREPFSGFMTPQVDDAGRRGIGRMRVLVQPVGGPTQHPASPWLRRPLRAAVLRAGQQVVQSLIDVHLEPSCFSWLGEWRPRGSSGWTAGTAVDEFERLKENPFVAATVRHRGGFSFWTTIPLLMATPEQGFCAYEHLWAAELIGQLAIAAQFFSEVPSAAVLRCDVALEGLDGSVAWRVSEGRVTTDSMVRVADTQFEAQGLFATYELAADPRDAVRELLDPFFASFLDEGYDVVGRLSSSP